MKKILGTSFLVIFAFIQLFAQTERVPLKEGDKAPNIKFEDLKGNNYRLSDLMKDDKKVLLCFMRPVWCPVCNARTHELIERYGSLKSLGYEVIVIYPSPVETLRDYAKDLSLPFIIVSDFEERLYGQYQVEKSQKKFISSMTKKESNVRAKKGSKLMRENNQKFPIKGDRHGPLVPADFVVDADLKLLRVFYGEFTGQHLSLDELK